MAKAIPSKILLPLILSLVGAVNPTFAADEPQTLDGHLAWAEVTRLSTPVSGVVTEIPVQPGQQVEKGTVLLRLDRKPLADRLAAAVAIRSGLVRAAAEAKRDAERTQQLYDRTVASESERQEALIKQEQAVARLNEARAKADLRQWELGKTTLTAPYPARILSVDTAVGETVSSELNAPVLLRIARADQMLVVANTSPDVASHLSLGQKMNVLVGQASDQAKVQGKLVGIVSEPQNNQNAAISYRLQVQIKPQKDWIAGLPAKIELSD
ncbi:efflux RND transporter periplasmic adaptor subunit [Halothiobacillus sp.]|uniref:efflux RND transporter periplasmic adaptor subunit n=1 Tax=Halothiobacillus sp. TaxID=1891311 RepID=UPI002609CCAA|nr:efflux RND transporter periplasmic adaptor subunit [Halothiobacillus sp.]MDD3575447.1 efflux RND transporter periplasmic adaptor subunit [Halothiobacillus sp.]MDD4965905.1 efflux RND transporter periplasmic adaptor subunit [Halothiobacillus sp.]MDY0147116.1 efflux RND transporter periplasmic adaptor subunit [Halothiobacillus sp.]